MTLLKSSDDKVSGVRVQSSARGAKVGRTYDLKTLRVALGLTQTEFAERAGMTQGDVSRLESREDARVSTLERCASALGGVLEIAVVIDGRRYHLSM
jgi:DNA-binding Xre family transcriptional regulator